MKKSLSVVILPAILLLVMFASENAPAAERAGNFEISPFVGYHWFDNETDYADDPVWGGRFGYLYDENLGAEITVATVFSDLRSSGAAADLLQLQVDALYNFRGLGKLVPFAAAGVGLAHYDPAAGSAKEDNFLINYGIGVRYFFTDNLAARLDLRQPVVFDDPDFNLMTTIGLSYFFGGSKQPMPAVEVSPVLVVKAPPVDSDGDGISDANDRCPETPAAVKVDARGCPPDRDGDGVSNPLDKCPDTPAGAPVDEIGCLKDSDRDGLTDWHEIRETNTDAHNPDSDDDGLNDGAEVNIHHTSPLRPDSDFGGVKDGLEVNIAKTNPLDPTDDVQDIKRIELQVYFATNSDVVATTYFPEIERVVNFLKENPELVGTIEGHTDSHGAAAYNQNLSERRARNLIKVAEERFGLETGRLTGIGYGGTRPVAANNTGEGRARNRRIEAVFSSR